MQIKVQTIYTTGAASGDGVHNENGDTRPSDDSISNNTKRERDTNRCESNKCQMIVGAELLMLNERDEFKKSLFHFPAVAASLHLAYYSLICL